MSRARTRKGWLALFSLTCEDCGAHKVAHVVRMGEEKGETDPASDEDVCICQACYEKMREG